MSYFVYFVYIFYLIHFYVGRTVEEILLPGYSVISRRDRTEGAKAGFGGIMTYAREDVCFCSRS